MSGVDVILWWHHHQPWYLDPRTGQARLPWVRLHACRGYLDMAAAAEHPSGDGVRHTFNFVPSLLDQLERYGNSSATDSWLDMSRPHPRDLDEATRKELVHRMGGGGPRPVRALPRLEELRGRVARNDTLEDQDVLDLTVLAHLGFCGATLGHREGPAKTLMHKGRGFTQDEKLALLHQTVDACGEVLARYRKLNEAGRIEITCTPYFHPILPLVIDSSSMSDGLPHHPQPPRFAWPQDARWHVEGALARCERAFGKRPAGMWPSEGSVSEAAVGLLADNGIRYCASDEMVLHRSHSVSGQRLDHGQPWLDPSGRIAMFFRDHAVSDLIGFTYRGKSPGDAAHDFLARARAFGQARAGTGRKPAMTVILDGENPWEHYPDAGREHLWALQKALSHARDVSVVSPSQHLEKHPARARLSRLHSGSWIDGTFAIWIGHEEDRIGWRMLGECRRAIERAQQEGVPKDVVERALQRLYPAEGSDWFWWFGEDFHAREADLYDELFREQIRSAYQALGRTAPARLDEPVRLPARTTDVTRRGPTGWPVHPVLSPFEPSAHAWAGAVKLRARDGGAMAGSAGPVEELWLGTTPEALWAVVRFRRSETPAGTLRLECKGPGQARILTVELAGGKVAGEGQAAVGGAATVQWPLKAAGLAPGDAAEVVLVYDGPDGEQRVPAAGEARVEVPDAREMWREAWG